MKKSRYTDNQILSILKQNESGTLAPDLRRDHDMSNATFYKQRSKYGGMNASFMKWMKELEDGNARLMKMYAEGNLKQPARPSKKVVTPPRHKEMAQRAKGAIYHQNSGDTSGIFDQ